MLNGDQEQRLRRALRHNEFRLVYQPQIYLTTGEVFGFEALLRWQTSEGETVRPDQFIPVLENTGLISKVGAWIIETACSHWRDWIDQRLVSEAMRLSINVSAHQFENGDLPRLLRRAMKKNALEPSNLEVELTESTVMLDTSNTRKALRQIRHLGIGLSMDDFGTGYATLAYLRRYRFDTLKIDRSFIQRICSRKKDLAIAMSMIQLAHILELKTVVEGIETPEQVASLRRMGCAIGQGHYFSYPLSAEDVPDFLWKWKGINSEQLPEN